MSILIQLAYDIDGSQIANRPKWLETSLYDVAAKPEEGIQLTRKELRPRLQALLRDRFHLAVHSETRFRHGYALVIGPKGSHLTPTKGDYSPDFPLQVGPGQMRGANWTMQQFAKYLTQAAGFPVVDETGLTGSYDISFRYNARPDTNSGRAPLDLALKRNTGLLLKSKRVPVETIVIDSVNKVPTPN